MELIKQVEPNSLESALISAIDATNEATELQVQFTDFECIKERIHIKGNYPKYIAERLAEIWGNKVRQFTSIRFSIVIKYFAKSNNKTLSYCISYEET